MFSRSFLSFAFSGCQRFFAAAFAAGAVGCVPSHHPPVKPLERLSGLCDNTVKSTDPKTPIMAKKSPVSILRAKMIFQLRVHVEHRLWRDSVACSFTF